MEKEERRRYVLAQLTSLPNAFQYMEVTQYIKNLETQLKKQQEIIEKAIEYIEEHRIKNPYHYEFNCFMGNARASDLLQILEDKEV